MKMENKKPIVGFIAGIIIIALLIGTYFTLSYSPWRFTEDRPIRIFILNSYHEDFPEGRLVHKYIDGFYDGLESISYETMRFDMDVLRKSSAELREESALEAKRRIDEYAPDLIFASDDDAQQLVIARYYLNTSIPVVVTSLAKDPANYGYVGSKNIAGILEREHFPDAIRFLQELSPPTKNIAVIYEDSPRWKDAIVRMKEQQNEISDAELVGWHPVSDFNDFKEKVLAYQDKVDAFLFTPLDNLNDGFGGKVLLIDVIKWLDENSRLPEVSLWPTPNEGMFAAVTYSPYEQGKAAGKISHDILINGKAPSSFKWEPTKKGNQYINLARAESLGMKEDDIPSIMLINSVVIKEFPWEKKG